jgi:hypothetical protein
MLKAADSQRDSEGGTSRIALEGFTGGAEAQRFAREPPPCGAGWPEVANEADVIFVYAKEPHEPGHLCAAAGV